MKLFLTLISVIILSLAIYLVQTRQSTQTSRERATPPTPSITTVNASFTPPTDQPRKTNSFFANLYYFPTEPVFYLPGIVKLTPDGIQIGIPKVTATPATVFGSFITYCTLTVGEPLTANQVLYYGDWNVMTSVKSATTTTNLNLVQGNPITYLTSDAALLTFDCPGAQITEFDRGYRIQKDGQTIDLQAQELTNKTATDSKITLASATQNYRYIIHPLTGDQLPTDLPWNPIHTTLAQYQIQDRQITTTYSLRTQTDDPTYMTIWPHHQPYLINPSPTLGDYQAAIGTLQLIEASQFSTVHDQPSLPLQFNKVTNPNHVTQIQTALQSDLEKYTTETPPEGVYFKGTWLGALTTIVQLTDLYLPDQHPQALQLLKDHLTLAGTEFEYNPATQMLVAKKPEFGNEEGNDHHFHYGYFIRAAAIATHYDPTYLPTIQPLIEQMIPDIANTDRENPRYPYLRAYGIYEGHSWAAGTADFGDGNNQESTSEALNAWYALHLWGQVTNDPDLQARASWLFTGELAGTQAYWFGYQNPFPTGYEHAMASIVWGGKRDFATWFSGHPMHIWGIQFLPMTPASAYLSTISTPQSNAQIQSTGNPYSHEWGDLYAAFQSYSDPQAAQIALPQITTDAGLKLTSLRYQIIYSNLQ